MQQAYFLVLAEIVSSVEPIIAMRFINVPFCYFDGIITYNGFEIEVVTKSLHFLLSFLRYLGYAIEKEGE